MDSGIALKDYKDTSGESLKSARGNGDSMLKSDTVCVSENANELQWPHCPALYGNCLVYDSTQRLGLEIYEALMTFIWSAEAGSRLTLQKNKDEFTLQITGAVYRSGGTLVNMNDLKQLRHKLDSLSSTDK